MNAFRITLLVLLTLVIALMFYAIQVVVPGWQGQYDEYVATQRVNELQMRTEAHRARISQLAPEVDSPEVASARSADAEVIRSNEQTLNEAEEQSVIAAARREEEARQVSEPRPEPNAPQSLGEVAAYDAEWGVLLIRPLSDLPMNNGLVLAVRHDGVVVCEATVDGKDDESGQYSATVKAVSTGAIKVAPQVGDEVIASPFLSAGELRNESGMYAPAAAPTPLPSSVRPSDELPSLPPDGANGLPEHEATLTPVP